MMDIAGRKNKLSLAAVGLTIWALAMAAVIWMAFWDIGLEGQIATGAVGVAGLLALYILKPTGGTRIFLISIVAYVSFRYFAWRTLHTLPPMDAPGFVPGVILYLAELQGFVMSMIGLFVNAAPIKRQAPPVPSDADAWPTVDVFVPTYDEAPELVERTLIAAKAMWYPKGRLAVHLLDDGGTDEKLSDSARGHAAVRRAEALKAICADHGVQYRTRPRNVNAKAGNLNAALPDTEGELILILDADHVPTRDFLKRTAGYFLTDDDLFLVQTPHFFINPDPLERNLGTFQSMPSEPEMFYGSIQKGLDSWNASFFCGSAALLRRKHVVAAGGIAGETITEDCETALDLHARGLNSLYVDRPMIGGLAPDTLGAFVTQRIRWAQGMTQILLLKNPLLKPGITLAQRICYLNSSGFWLFPFARLIFLIAPLFYLFFGLQIFDATFPEFLAYTVFHLVAALTLTNWMHGKFRWSFISDLYELVQAPFTARAILSVLRRPRSPEFKVTPKAENVKQDFISQLAPVFLGIFALAVAGLAVGLWRWGNVPLDRGHLTIVMGWNIVNLFLIVGSLGVVMERASRSAQSAMARAKPANLILENGAGSRVTIVDVADTTAQLEVDMQADIGRLSGCGLLQCQLPGEDRLATIPVELHSVRERHGKMYVVVKMIPETQQEKSDMVGLVFGDSENWVRFQGSRRSRRPILMTLSWMFLRGLLGVGLMIKTLVRRRNTRRVGEVS